MDAFENWGSNMDTLALVPFCNTVASSTFQLLETVGKLWTNMFATLALQIKVAFEGGAQESVETTVRGPAELQGKCEHDMELIRVLQQVNTRACNWDCPEKPSQEGLASA